MIPRVHETTPDALRYVFGRTSGSELAAGIQLRQLPAAVLGTALAGLALHTMPSDLDIVAAVVVFTAGAAAATQPVAGHRLDEWIPLWIGWVRDRVVGDHRWRSTAPVIGHHAGRAEAVPPPPFRGIELLSATVQAGDVGAAADRARDIYGAALRIESSDLLLSSDAARQQRLAAWGGVLASAARTRSPIHRVQWMQRTVPDDGAALTAWFERRATPGDAAASYRELLSGSVGDARRHESVVAVSVAAGRAGSVPRDRAERTAHMLRMLAHEIDLISERLSAGGFTVRGVVSPAALSELLRCGFDPFSPRPVRTASAPVAWPLATETGRHWYRSDAAWHATYWIEQWPRLPVPGAFLAPLILGGPPVRAISIIAEPVSATRATHQVERDMVSAAVNDALRERAGFRITARRRQQIDTTARRERDLAAGHEEFNTVGLVTVSGRSVDELQDACSELEQLAQQAHLGVRRLWGRQAEGFAAAQPLALGMR